MEAVKYQSVEGSVRPIKDYQVEQVNGLGWQTSETTLAETGRLEQNLKH